MKFFLAFLMIFTVIATDFGSDHFDMKQGCNFQESTNITGTPAPGSSDCGDSSDHHHCAHDCSHVKIANDSIEIALAFFVPKATNSQYSFLYASPFAKLVKRPPITA